MLLQNLLQPCFILPGSAQILSGKEAVLHDGHGEELGLGMDARVLGTGGTLLGEGEHGEIPVGFQNGVLHGGDVQHVLFPQVPRQLVQRHPGAAEIVLHQLSVFNQDYRLAAQQLPELHAVQNQSGQHQLRPQNRQYRHQPGIQGDRPVLHGNCRQICQQHGHNKLRRLHLPDLPLAGETKAHNEQQIVFHDGLL